MICFRRAEHCRPLITVWLQVRVLPGTCVRQKADLPTPAKRPEHAAFTARLLEPATARNLWVGNGQVNAGGLLFVGDRTSASSSVAAIFDDLHQKGAIGPSS